QLSGESMQEYGGDDGSLGLTGELGQEARDQSGEDISDAASRQGGRAGRVNRDAAVGKSSQRVLALEDDTYAMSGGERTDGSDSIRFNLLYRFLDQAG